MAGEVFIAETRDYYGEHNIMRMVTSGEYTVLGKQFHNTYTLRYTPKDEIVDLETGQTLPKPLPMFCSNCGKPIVCVPEEHSKHIFRGSNLKHVDGGVFCEPTVRAASYKGKYKVGDE